MTSKTPVSYRAFVVSLGSYDNLIDMKTISIIYLFVQIIRNFLNVINNFEEHYRSKSNVIANIRSIGSLK